MSRPLRIVGAVLWAAVLPLALILEPETDTQLLVTICTVLGSAILGSALLVIADLIDPKAQQEREIRRLARRSLR